MGDYNLGSIGMEVLLLVPDTPSTLSGLPIQRIADRQRSFAENFTGQTVGSNSITLQFQGPIIDLTAGKVLKSLEAEDSASESLKLGDFSTKSASSSVGASSNAYLQNGMDGLNQIGRKVRFFKSNG